MTLSVLDAATEAPDATALVVGETAVSFAELADAVRRNLSWLDSRGLARPSANPVAIVGTSDRATLELVFALIEQGRPIAFVHPRLLPAERKPLLDLFPPARVLDPLASARHAIGADPAQRTEPGAETCLAIVFTSGTTGRPKGVALSRRAFLASARASEQNLGWRDGDRWLLGLPIAHVGGLSILTRCLIGRKTVVVPAEVAAGHRLSADGIALAIERHAVTLVSLVPTQLEWLLAEGVAWRPPPGLRAILLGGAPARPSLLSRAADLGLPVLTTYGLTEACSQVTTQTYGTTNRGELGAGAPLTGVDVRIGGDGTIEVRGPTLLSGFFPGALPAPFDDGGWFRTDDVGRLDASGNLHVAGRRTDCVITGGENVFPGEVEAILEECPAVSRACVFGVPDDIWGETVAAAIVPAGEPDPTTIVEFCRFRLAPHRRPRRLAFVDALETTEAGKLDRRGTKDLARARLRPLEPS